MAPLWMARPRLALKIQRPYVCCAWEDPVRLAALLGHYEFFCQLFAPEVREAIYGDGATILRISGGEDGGKWDLQLFYHDRFEKEGDLTLAIREVESGVTLAGLTFCIARNNGERIAIVGGLQAGAGSGTLSHIHNAAKAMYGLRPKALVLWCLQQLAEPWQITQIQAVGDARHVWRHWRKKLDIAASYDEFWKESDGRRLAGGENWMLPLKSAVRSRTELKPSRRKTYERRYAMLNALKPRLLDAVAALAPGGQRLHDPTAASAEFFIPVRASFPPSNAISQIHCLEPSELECSPELSL
jgi:uncharacterized protein VirK/YbjX